MDFVKRSKEVFDAEITQLAKVRTNIGGELSKLIQLILSSNGKVVVTGVGKSGIIGHKISSTLVSTGTNSVFMNAGEALHGDLGIVCKGDIVIAISNSGSAHEILSILAPLKKIGCPIVAMTGGLKSPLAKQADIVIDCNVDYEASNDGLAPTCSTTATLVMGDALAICLMESRSFKPENFALYHPGGELGKRLLTRVKDRMNKNIPRVEESSAFKDVIYQVSNMRQGMTLVYKDGKATGIITDGDIRRAVQKYDDLKSLTAKDIMTNGFKCISPETVVTEALKLMDINKITSLVVVEDATECGEILGILHIHNIFDFKK